MAKASRIHPHEIVFNPSIYMEIAEFHNKNANACQGLSQKIQNGNLENGRLKGELDAQIRKNSEIQKKIEDMDSSLKLIQKNLAWVKDSESQYEEEGTCSIINRPLDTFMDKNRDDLSHLNSQMKEKPKITFNQPKVLTKEKKTIFSWDKRVIECINETLKGCETYSKLFWPSTNVDPRTDENMDESIDYGMTDQTQFRDSKQRRDNSESNVSEQNRKWEQSSQINDHQQQFNQSIRFSINPIRQLNE